jgi:hypothetical protein
MIETILLAITNICIIAFLIISQYLYAKERKDLIRSLIAKSLQEIGDIEYLDKLKPQKEIKEKINTDLVPVDKLNESQWDKMIKHQLEQAVEKNAG